MIAATVFLKAVLQRIYYVCRFYHASLCLLACYMLWPCICLFVRLYMRVSATSHSATKTAKHVTTQTTLHDCLWSLFFSDAKDLVEIRDKRHNVLAKYAQCVMSGKGTVLEAESKRCILCGIKFLSQVIRV